MALTALGMLAAAAATTYGTVQSSKNASAANKTAAQTTQAGLQQQQNDAQYTKALNALALRRSTAGTTDSRGSTASYDPATNSWRTTLSPAADAIQRQGDAYTSQNLKDVTQGNAATLINNQRGATAAGLSNDNALVNAIRARGDAETARMRLENFRPQTVGDVEGGMQQVATTANRQAQQPIIADTLRSMARTGTAAGPVLTQMMRDNATSLRQTMLQDHIAAMQNTDSINNSRRQGLLSTLSGLTDAGTPRLQFAGQSGLGSAQPTDPGAAISSEIASRAAGAGTTGIQAGSVANQGGNASIAARKLSADYTPYNNSGDILSSLTKQVGNSGGLVDQIKKVASMFGGGGAGNAGDAMGTQAARYGDEDAALRASYMGY